MKYATQVAPNSHSSKPLQQRLAKSPHRIRTHIVMDHNENEGTIESGTFWVVDMWYELQCQSVILIVKDSSKADAKVRFQIRGWIILPQVKKCTAWIFRIQLSQVAWKCESTACRRVDPEFQGKKSAQRHDKFAGELAWWTLNLTPSFPSDLSLYQLAPLEKQFPDRWCVATEEYLPRSQTGE